jgi:hypothetical protein
MELPDVLTPALEQVVLGAGVPTMIPAALLSAVANPAMEYPEAIVVTSLIVTDVLP